MKFIGQYIQSFIARFRSDVYLEDIDTGTIASGGNLGLDSNNKIVKGTAPLGTLTTLTVDEITIDGDTITASDDLNIVADGNDITVDTDNFTIESATSVKPTFTLKATVNSNKPANLAFVKDKGAAGANGDFIGDTYYASDNDAQEQIIMAMVSGKVADATNGAEEGEYIISVKNTSSATAPRPSLTLTGDGAVTNATIGYGVSSRINIAGVLLMNGTDTINNSGVIQVAAQTVIDHDQLANYDANKHYTQANITTVGTIGTGVWNGDAIAHAYIAAAAIETDNIADAQVTVAKLHADAIQTSGETFADNDTSLMTSAAIDDRIRVKSKHVLRCNTFYASGNWVQNSLFIGNSVGNNPYNWNDQAAVGGAISTTSSFTIIGDDENWGIVLPVDISKIEVQCSVRPSGNPGAIDFSVAVYTGVRSSDSSGDLTLTKIGHKSVSFNSSNQRYKQNDLTGDDAIVGNYDAGTMIYVGVGTEDAPNNAKNGRGYMNITVTER